MPREVGIVRVLWFFRIFGDRSLLSDEFFDGKERVDGAEPRVPKRTSMDLDKTFGINSSWRKWSL